MLIPVLCHCGRSLADIYDAYKVLKAQKMAAQGEETLPEYAGLGKDVDMKLDEELTALGLTKDDWCCRMLLMTSVDFRSLY